MQAARCGKRERNGVRGRRRKIKNRKTKKNMWKNLWYRSESCVHKSWTWFIAVERYHAQCSCHIYLYTHTIFFFCRLGSLWLWAWAHWVAYSNVIKMPCWAVLSLHWSQYTIFFSVFVSLSVCRLLFLSSIFIIIYIYLLEFGIIVEC